MKREEILDLARAAGFSLFTSGRFAEQGCIERFAALIRAATKEEDAKICDEIESEARKDWKAHYLPYDQGREAGAFECSEALREKE